MSTTVDNRIVKIELDADELIKNSDKAVAALKKVENAIKLNGVADGSTKATASIRTLSNEFSKTGQEAEVAASKIKGSLGQSLNDVAAAADDTSARVSQSMQEMVASVGEEAERVSSTIEENTEASGERTKSRFASVLKVLAVLAAGAAAAITVSILAVSKATGVPAREILQQAIHTATSVVSHVTTALKEISSLIIGGIKGIITKTTTIKDAIRAIIDWIKETSTAVVNFLKNLFPQISENFKLVSDGIKLYWDDVCKALEEKFGPAVEKLKEKFDGIKGHLSNFASYIKDKFHESKESMDELGDAADKTAEKVQNAADKAGTAANEMAGEIQNAADKALIAGPDIGASFTDGMSKAEQKFSDAIGTITGESQAAKESVSSDAASAAEESTKSVNKFAQGAKGVLSDVKQWFTAEFSNVGDRIKSGFTKMGDGIKNAYQEAGGLKGMIGSLGNSLKTFAPTLLTMAPSLLGIGGAAGAAGMEMGQLGDMAYGTGGRIGGLKGKINELLQIFKAGVILNWAKKASDRFEKLFKSITIDQVAAGWDKYAKKTESVGTIMAATGDSIEEVNTQLERLQWFADETSYNFTDMVDNIGKFTSNGVELDTATTAMEGIANWAALSGQNAGTASRAMYNLSQAIGMGAVKLADWKSIELANMGTKEFKETAIETAEALGYLKKTYSGTYVTTSKGGKSGEEVNANNFRETLTTGWFSNEVLLGTLDKYGAYTNALHEVTEETGLYASDIIKAVKAYDGTSDSIAEYAKAAAKNGVSLQKFEESIMKLSGRDTEKIAELSKSLGINEKTVTQMALTYDGTTSSLQDFEAIAKSCGLTLDELAKKIEPVAEDTYALGKKAFAAGQEARTFTAAIDSVKDAMSTSIMDIFETLFGNYEKSKVLWTDLANNLYDLVVTPVQEVGEVVHKVFDSPYTGLHETLTELEVDTEEFEREALRLANSTRKSTERFDDFDQALAAGAIDAETTDKALKKLGVKGLTEIAEGAGKKATEVLGEFNPELRAAVDAMDDVGGMQKIATIFSNTFGQINTIWEKTREIFTEKFFPDDSAGSGISKLIDKVYGFIDKFTNYEEGDGSEADNFWKTFMNTISGVVDVLHSAWEIITAVGDAIKEAFVDVFGDTDIFATGSGLLGFVDIITGTLKKLLGFIRNSGLFDALKGLFTGVFTLVKAIVDVLSRSGRAVEGKDGVFLESMTDGVTKSANLLTNGLGIVTKVFEKSFGIIGKIFTKVRDVVTPILESFTKGITNFFKGVDAAGNEVSVWDKVAGAGGILAGLNTAIGAIIAIIAIVKKSGGKGVGVIDKFFKNVSTSLTKGFSSIGGTIGQLFNPLNAILNRFFSGIGDTFGKMGEAINGLSKTLRAKLKIDMIKAIGEAIWSLAKSILVIVVALLILSTIDPAKLAMAVGALTHILGVLAAFCALMTKLGPQINDEGIANSDPSSLFGGIMKLAISLLLVSISLGLVAEVIVKAGLENALVAFGILELTLVSLSSVVIGITYALKKTDPKQAEASIGLVISLAAAMKVAMKAIRKLIKAIDNYGADAAWTALKIFEIVLLSFAAVLTILIKLKDSDPKAINSVTKAIIMMATSMLIVALAIKMMVKKLEGEDEAATRNAMIMLMVALGAFAAVIRILSKAAKSENDTVKQATAIAIMAASLILVAIAVKTLAEYNWDQLAMPFGGLIAVLTAFSVVIRSMSKAAKNENGVIKQAVAIAIMAGALVAIAAGVKMLAKYSWDKLIAPFVGIILILAEFAIVMRALSKIGDPKKVIALTVPIIILSGCLVAIAAGMAQLAKNDWPGIAAAGVSLVVILGVMAVILGAFAKMPNVNAGKLTAIAAAFVILSAALLVVALAISLVAQYDPARVIVAAGAILVLVGIIALLGAVLTASGVGIAGLEAVTIALVGIGAACALIATAIYLFSAAVSKLIDALINLAASAPTIIAAIMMFLASLPAMIALAANAIKIGGPIMASSILDTISKILQIMKAKVPQVGNNLFDMVDAVLDVLIDRLPGTASKLGAALLSTLAAVIQIITAYAPTIISLLGSLIAVITISVSNVLIDLVPLITIKVTLTLLSIIQQLTNAIGTYSEEFARAIRSAVFVLGAITLDAIKILLDSFGLGGLVGDKLDSAKAYLMGKIEEDTEDITTKAREFGSEKIEEATEVLAEEGENLSYMIGNTLGGVRRGFENASSDSGSTDAAYNLGASGPNAIAEGINDGTETATTAAENSGSSIFGTLSDSLGLGGDGEGTDLSSITNMGADIPAALGEGILSGTDDAEDDAEESGEAIVNTYASTVDANQNSSARSRIRNAGQNDANNVADAMDDPTAKRDATEAGRNLVRGYGNGISDSTVVKSVVEKGRSVVRNVLKAMNSEQQSQSPAKAGNQIGRWLTQGYGLGIEKDSKFAEDKASEVVRNTVDRMKNSLRYANDIYSGKYATATFTPVIDSTGFENSVAGVRNRLDNTIQTRIPRMESASISRSIDISRDEDLIVGAINGLEAKFSSLSADMKNLKIIMDSGELVGAVTDKVDYALGANVTRRRRGV